MFSTFTGNRDTDDKILLGLPYPTLLRMCRSDKYLQSICSDESFWANRVAKDYGFEILKLKPQNESFSKQYAHLYRVKTGLEDILQGKVVLIEESTQPHRAPSVLMNPGHYIPYILKSGRLDDLLLFINLDIPLESLAGHIFSAEPPNPIEMLHLLESKGLKPAKLDSTIAMFALNSDDPEILEWLHQRGTFLGTEDNVYWAIRFCNLKSLEWFYNKYGEDIFRPGMIRNAYNTAPCQQDAGNWLRSRGFLR